MFTAPGFPWLLRHELRVLWRGSILMRTHRRVIGPVLVVGALFQGVALLLARKVVAHPIPADQMLLAANINIVFLFALMFSRAMTSCIDVMYGRGDADFLLASPIPPGRVLAVRMLGVAVSIASPWLLLGGVLGNALAIYGQFWGLSVYPMFLAEALLVAALAFAVVVVLLRFISPQATRRTGHSLALFTGVGIFVIGQLPRFVPVATLGRFWTSLLPGPEGGGLAFLFARGLLGQPDALAAATAFALAGFCIVLFFLAKPFADGVITAAASRPRGSAGAQAGKFRGSPFAASIAKDFRLLTRFPGVVTQIIYRSLTLVPVALVLAGHFHMGGVASSLAATVPLMVFLAGQLGLFFISVLAGCETIPELVATAPVAPAVPRRAALAASAYATVAILAIPALAVMARAPHLLPALLFGTAGVLLSNLLLGQRLPIPLVRATFGKTSTGTVLGLILGVSVSSIWSFMMWLAVAHNPLAWLLSAKG